MNNFKEKAMKIVFLLTASFSILAVALICVFLFANGIPAIKEIGLPDFLLGTKWKPGNNLYGIFPMILGSIYVTAGAIVVGVPIGILMAIFMARFCPEEASQLLKADGRPVSRNPGPSYMDSFWSGSHSTICKRTF